VDAAIDREVYALYGLMEEIALVEEPDFHD
jgi:hypothetical protein